MKISTKERTPCNPENLILGFRLDDTCERRVKVKQWSESVSTFQRNTTESLPFVLQYMDTDTSLLTRAVYKLPQQVDTLQALVNKNPLISRVLEACYCLTPFGIWGCTKFSVLKQWPSHFLFPKPNKLLLHPRATSAKKISLRLSNIYRGSKHYDLDLIWYTGSIQGIIGRHRDEANTRASANWVIECWESTGHEKGEIRTQCPHGHFSFSGITGLSLKQFRIIRHWTGRDY